MAVIRVAELVKRYRAVAALDGVSFTVENGGPVALVGKNGAGKTTLLSVLAGILVPTSGTVEVLGLPLGDPRLLGRIGVLMQDASFRNGISGLDQVLFMARVAGMERESALRAVMEVLEELGEADFAHLSPETMSFGQRKRLAMAQALLGQPSMVLLDEPTAGLDPAAAQAVRLLIRKRCADTLFIVSSHNLYEVQDICKRVLVIDRGLLVDDVDIASLSEDTNRLSVTLNHAVEPALVDVLMQIAEITDIARDAAAPEKLQMDIATADIDRLQLQIQSVLNAHGYSVTNLTRGRTLVDDLAARQ